MNNEESIPEPSEAAEPPPQQKEEVHDVEVAKNEGEPSPTSAESPEGNGDAQGISHSPRRANRRVSEANITAAAVRRMSHRVSINKEGQNRRMSVTATSAPFDVSYHPGIAKFFSAPYQRQRWGDTQILPRVNWGDLFFDLFYVAATYNTSNILVESPSKEGLLYFAATFCAVMSIWWDKTYYDGRFVVGDDLYHRFFEVFHLLVLASVVVHIRPVDILSNPSKYVDMFGLCLSLCVSYVFSFIRQSEVYFAGVGERQLLKSAIRREYVQTMIFILFFGAAAVISGLEFFGDSGDDKHRNLAEAATYNEKSAEPNHLPIWLCVAAEMARWIFMGVKVASFPNDGTHKKFMVPMNIDFSIHRTSEWTMLMLGESILSLLIVDVPTENSGYMATFYCSLLTVVLLQILHFRSQPHTADEHASRRDKNAAICWMFFQYLYSMALVGLGAAFTLFVIEFSYDDHRRLAIEGRLLAGGGPPKYDTEERQQRLAHLFSVTLTTVFVSLDMMSFLHVGWKKGQDRCRCKRTKKKNVKGLFLTAVRGGLYVFAATLSQWTTSPKLLAGIGLGITFVQLGIRKVGAFLFPTQVHAVNEETEKANVEESVMF